MLQSDRYVNEAQLSGSDSANNTSSWERDRSSEGLDKILTSLLDFKPQDELDRRLLLGILPKLKNIPKGTNLSEHRRRSLVIDADLSRTAMQSNSKSGLTSYRT